MNKMKRTAFVLSFAVVVCFVFSLSQAGKGGNPGVNPPPEPPGQGAFPPGISFKIDIVETDPIWQITQGGTNISVSWADHKPNPRFAIYDAGGNNHMGEEYYCDDVVLDKETGLVWERCPELSEVPWGSACYKCGELFKGKRAGWRLAALEELQTLFYPAAEDSEVGLPRNHPFIGVSIDQLFWTKSTDPLHWQAAVTFQFLGLEGSLSPLSILSAAKHISITHDAWCVRGGPGHDASTPKIIE
jgi:hypothetical protein